METKEQIDMNPQIVNDEAGILTLEELRNQRNRDIEQAQEYIEKLDKDIENYKPQLKLAEELWAILENKETYKKIEPTWEFEKNPRYWEIQHEQNMFKIRDERAKSQNTLEGMYTQKEYLVKQLEDLKAKLADIEGDEKNE